jgi:signal transduction histidine kinase/CheY-like chemotaxis protein
MPFDADQGQDSLPAMAPRAGVFGTVRQMLAVPANFQPPALEAGFREDYTHRYKEQRQIICILALVSWCFFCIADIWYVENFPQLRVMQYRLYSLRAAGAIVITLATVFAYSEFALVDRIFNKVFFCLHIGIFSIQLYTTYIVESMITSLYYVIGLYLIMIFVSCLSRLRYPTVVYSNLYFLIAGSILLLFCWPSLSSPHLRNWPGEFFLICFVSVGLVIISESERATRNTFLREHRLTEVTSYLADKNAKLAAAQADLENRTAALIAVKEESRLRAQRDNMRKSKFLADAAHDLRQPMQALSNYLEAAAFAIHRGDQANGAALIDQAQRALTLTRTSLGGILDISSFDSGFIQPAYANFDIKQVLRDVTDQFHGLAAEYGVTIRLRRQSDAKLIVHSDPHLLSRVLANLISNAIKYSSGREGGGAAVLAGVVAFPNRASVEVIDNGIGIPQAQWSRIFAPFVQLDNPDQNRERGAGLGLSIVNAILQMLDGHRLELNSTVGKGTRFTVEIPRSDDEASAVAAIAESARPANFADLAGSFILYIDDDALVRDSVARIFEAEDILYQMAGTLAGLASCLRGLDRIPDAVICDYRLSDGHTAGDAIRLIDQELKTEIPIIIVTAEMSALTSEPWYSPAIPILRKPVSAATLLQAVSELTGGDSRQITAPAALDA